MVERKKVKLDIMSQSIVDIITKISKNKGIAMLLINNTDNPYSQSISDNDMSNLTKIHSDNSKIYPFPFNPEAETKDGSFIRVYYNYGELDSSETIADLDLHIDIVVAKQLWLINDGTKSYIRPYEIMGRVIDLIGRRSSRDTIGIEINGFQHLSVNNSFDAIRVYCKNMSVESK